MSELCVVLLESVAQLLVLDLEVGNALGALLCCICVLE